MLTVADFDINELNHIFEHILNKQVRYDDREDVKSDAVLRILEEVHKNSIKTNFISFAHTVIQRTVIEYYRKKNRMIVKNSTSVNFCDGVDKDVGSTVDFFSYKIEDKGYEMSDVRTDYLNNIGLFTKTEQLVMNELLFNKDCYDMKMSEISRRLGLDKSHATRAFKKLRKLCATA